MASQLSKGGGRGSWGASQDGKRPGLGSFRRAGPGAFSAGSACRNEPQLPSHAGPGALRSRAQIPGREALNGLTWTAGRWSGSPAQMGRDHVASCSEAQMHPSVCAGLPTPAGAFLPGYQVTAGQSRTQPSPVETEGTICILIKEVQRPKALGSCRTGSPKCRKACTL